MQIYRSLSPIQAMTFDLDDTLYDNRPVIHHVEEQVALWLFQHHPVTAKQTISMVESIKSKIS